MSKIKDKLKTAASNGKTLLKYGLSGGIGGAIGEGISEISKYSANINFRVRPELASLNGYEALFSGHFNDWAWKMNPSAMTAIAVAGCAIVGMGLVYYATRD
jgi:hypothetical protein